ncbi:MAG: AAA family ATPase [Pirellulaceae bacterium]
MNDVAPTQHLTLGRRLHEIVLEPMKRAFVGKDEIIDLLGLCLVARENLFLLGPPGTAKSALVQDLARRIDGRVFDYLLTRFTEPNEIFGPFDIRKLRDGELTTNTEGMLPEASLVFLDELLNANSAILNSLLMVLNERVFRRGRETRALPTLMVVGASNHLPEDDALAALFDRFLVRAACENAPQEMLSSVLEAGWRLELEHGRAEATVGVAEIQSLHELLPRVNFSALRPDYVELVHRLRRAGIAVSDRRAVKIQRLLAASALLSGRLTADRTDLWVLRYIWDAQEQQQVLASHVQQAMAEAEEEQWQTAHPRARGDERPDPQRIAEDLAAIKRQLDQAEASNWSEVELALSRDRLGTLASRLQWIADEQQQAFLQGEVDALWRRLEQEP